MGRVLGLAVGALALWGGVTSGAAQGLDAASIEPIGRHFELPSGVSVDGLRFGGISALDPDPLSGGFMALSDDRVEFGPARMFRIDLALGPEGVTGLDLKVGVPLSQIGGAAYPPLSVDPEALRFVPSGDERGLIYWAHERDTEGRPHAGVMDRTGEALRAFTLPDYYMPVVDAAGARISGVADNYGFESLAVDAAGRVILANESALIQDGPRADAGRGALARVLVMDAAAGAPISEHLYPVDPVHARPQPADSFVVSGLVDLLFDPTDGGFFALERSFAVGHGHLGKIYKTRLDGASDVLGLVSVAEHPATPMQKTLLGTLSAGPLAPTLMNVEALAFGPEVEGRRTLIVVSDDNFGRGQSTQFFLFALIE